MSTVNTILKRSVAVADQLDLYHVVLVLYQAINAKAQQLCWKDDELTKSLVFTLCQVPPHVVLLLGGTTKPGKNIFIMEVNGKKVPPHVVFIASLLLFKVPKEKHLRDINKKGTKKYSSYIANQGFFSRKYMF